MTSLHTPSPSPEVHALRSLTCSLLHIWFRSGCMVHDAAYVSLPLAHSTSSHRRGSPAVLCGATPGRAEPHVAPRSRGRLCCNNTAAPVAAHPVPPGRVLARPRWLERCPLCCTSIWPVLSPAIVLDKGRAVGFMQRSADPRPALAPPLDARILRWGSGLHWAAPPERLRAARSSLGLSRCSRTAAVPSSATAVVSRQSKLPMCAHVPVVPATAPVPATASVPVSTPALSLPRPLQRYGTTAPFPPC